MVSRIIDLSQADVRALDPLMEEEESLWLKVLGWDYGPTRSFLRDYIMRRMLPGVAMVEGGKPVGYLYMVIEPERALLGNLYVAKEHWGQGLESEIALSAVTALQSSAALRRIEAQLVLFSGADIREAMIRSGFEVYRRHFLALDLKSWQRGKARPADLQLRAWHGSMIEEAARLVYEGYVDGIDSHFSSTFARPNKCQDFMANIVQRLGCGRFLPRMTTVGFGAEGEMRGVVIATELSPGVGHLPQITVKPDFQGRGFGAFLVEESLTRFKKAGYRTVSLTVTEANTKAESWYRRMGFAGTLEFYAYLWQRPAG